ncbi:hypothetical protein SAMN04488040_3202 [Sulfitobacter marinus]|uniref:Uncharacterized protein n=1 Tax=Sulfitobacter marinus TaxID=394264 RepID=A0A1I6VBS1_9RHOB|nr:hypothetical protein [Sulfitobacter marinus]SFT11161.1 hypothetical protein SAMN04488040_3202 [Sulfitobacter marinus]
MQMTIGIGTHLGQTPTGDHAAAPVPNVSHILTDGWRAVHPRATALSPATPPLVVTRQGFDGSGNPATQTDQVTLSSRIREPYPDHETLTDDEIALSDFIYAGDSISGVTNTSTRAYPKPVAMWLNHDREHASGPVHTLRLAVAHGFARLGQPVAAVAFVASDGVTSVTQIVSSMTSAHFDASGLHVPHFATDMDLTSLTQGAELTIDAVIYPWVGDPFTISTDADAYPSPNLTTLRLLNDRTGAYGTAFAYVDALAGNDATGAVASDAATASAAPFATIVAACVAIRTFNTNTYGRANDTGGGIIRLVEGVHDFTPFKSQGASTHVPLIIEAADPAKRGSTVLTDGGTSKFNAIPTQLKIRDLTLRKTGESVVFLDSGAASPSHLFVTENCIWDANNTSYYGAWVYRVGRFFQRNCATGAGGDPQQGNFFSTEATMVTAIGCDRCAGTITYQAAGCSNLPEFTWRAPTSARPAMEGIFLGWNVFSNGSTLNPIININAPIGPRGLAFVGNIVESWGSSSNAAVRLNADSDANPAENVVFQHNSIIGERINLMYLDGAVNVAKSAHVSFNLFELLNIKSDLFASQGGNTGNWPVRYKVGWSHNAVANGSNNAADYSPVSWLGEIASAGESTGTATAFADNRSHLGFDTGGGDYTPALATTLPVIPVGRAAYRVDLMGNAITAGQSRIGAITTTA